MNKKTLLKALADNQKLLDYTEKGLEKGMADLEDYKAVLQQKEILTILLKQEEEKEKKRN